MPVSVIDHDPATRGRLQMQLGEDVHGHASVDEFTDAYVGGPAVVVLGPSCAAVAGLAGAEELVVRNPGIGAVLIGDVLTTELFQRAMRTGIRDVLAAPVDTAQLHEAVDRVAAAVGATSAIEPPTAARDDDGERGQIITVFSAKGGAGTSVVATNLAVLLAQRGDGEVALIDVDLQFGDVAVMMKLAPKHTIVDAIHAIDTLDAGHLQSLLIRHPGSGVMVLPAPFEPAFADQVTSANVHQLVAMLQSAYRYVVVDTPAYFNDVVLGVLEQSDEVVLVAGMDIPTIKNMKVALQTMRLLDMPMSKVHLIINRANSKVQLDVGEVERTLQAKAEVFIPSDIVVPQSVNRGAPVVLDAPKSGVSRALAELANVFAPVEDKRRRWR